MTAAKARRLKHAQPDSDGPLAALPWPEDFWVTRQTPAPGTRMWRRGPIVIEWSYRPGGEADLREPRWPLPPDDTLAAEERLPHAGFD